MRRITKIALAWELFEQQIPKTHIAEYLDVYRKTIHRWITGIEKRRDIEVFIDKYLLAKKGSRKKKKVDGLLKKLILSGKRQISPER